MKDGVSASEAPLGWAPPLSLGALRITGSAVWAGPGGEIWPASWSCVLTLPTTPSELEKAGGGWNRLSSVGRVRLRSLLLILDDVNFDICLCVSPGCC